MYFNLGESNLELACETSASEGFCVRRPNEEFSAFWLREGCSKQKPMVTLATQSGAHN